MTSTDSKRVRVAVIGSGLAGLVIAYLLNKDKRYDVEVLESGPVPSLDAASLSVKDGQGRVQRIDIPMRAFSGGYYRNLKSMYDFLGIQYQRQRFRFVFSRQDVRSAKCAKQVYFVHASNNHEMPPRRPQGLSLINYLLELLFVACCYIWFTACCFVVEPKKGRSNHVETFGQYIKRIMLPDEFVSLYLLPLMSSVATCSHRELLQFPASDLVTYRKCILFGEQFVVSGGVKSVQDALLRGVKIRTLARVSSVESTAKGIRLCFDQQNKGLTEQLFDRVVLAVPPNVAASIFLPAWDQLSRVPVSRPVTSVTQSPVSYKNVMSPGEETEDINLNTSNGATEASHYQKCGVVVSSHPDDQNLPSHSLARSTFTRTLRTPSSKAIVEDIFRGPRKEVSDDKDKLTWKNGDEEVWLTGAWCWDGMVLLEGAVVSAIRVARDFGVGIPWEK